MMYKIIYIGDFDMKNHNVQSHLVRSNGRILEGLGYVVYYIGVDRNSTSLNSHDVDNINSFIHVPNTLNFSGFKKYKKVKDFILQIMSTINSGGDVCAVISYQSPTFSPILKHIVNWCHKNKVVYIVNSADIPLFRQGNVFRRLVMKYNWSYMHRINKKYADGIIAVSRFIQDFYSKKNRPSIIIPPILDKECDINQPETPVGCINMVYAGTPFVLNRKNVSPSSMKDRLDVIIELVWHLYKKGIKIKLDILGITIEEYTKGIPRQTAMISEMNDSVLFHGRVSHQETLDRVRAADATINYRDENIMTKAGLSTKIVESISLGTPVIINDIGDTFLYLKDGYNGFKLSTRKIENFKLLENIVERLSENRTLYKNNCLKNNPFLADLYVDSFSKFMTSCLKGK